MADSKNKANDANLQPLCMVFANTVAWHASPHPQETLHSYSELARWAQEAGLFSAPEARKLARLAEERPADAARAFRSAVALREAIYRILVASIRGKSPASSDLAELNQTIRRSTRGAQLVLTAEGYRWTWKVPLDALDSLIGLIALSASEFLVSENLKRAGQCADDRGCGWLFLDTSKNRTRRWCDVRDCGNRARQRRFQKRARRDEA
jgi:predicted RNA-binding Zn ribbon-like protein